MSIFVSIAAYRDPELVPTIQDCLAKAQQPDELRFGICWQHGDAEQLPSWLWLDPRFRIIDVDWYESAGACWARSQIMGLCRGEDHYLQIDSHHRFVDRWDTKMIEHAVSTASPKPILSTYCPMYVPGSPATLSSTPTQMTFDAFTDDGIVTFRPTFIANWEELNRPVRARFLSGHFLFAPGSFVEDVPYNPDLYFIGEEITLAIRAYTHGYDLFHPTEALLWHEYGREGRRKHWEDHAETGPVQLAWHKRDSKSREEVRRFLEDPPVGRFGCGSERTFAEYNAYAGINFRVRKVQDYTRLGFEPPNPTPTDNWEETTRSWKVSIVLMRSQLPAEALDDAEFWYVGFHDASGAEMYRQDLSSEELVALLARRTRRIAFERTFESSSIPSTWTVWPVSRSSQWLDRISGAVHRTL